MKRQYKVCVYAICKNEEMHTDRWMDSMNEADTVVVTDTGSDDHTVRRLQSRGALVYETTVTPWRFDTARNLSLSRVPTDTDICVCTDLDEVFVSGWRAELERAWAAHDTSGVALTGRYLYNWSFKPDGTPDVQFNYFKIHSREGFRWRHPVHECLYYEGALPLRTVMIGGITLNHYPDAAKPRSSYLSLLEMAVAEEPSDARMAYYLGREYMYAGRWKDCIRALLRHLSLPAARWDEERCASMRWIARCYVRLDLPDEGYRWYRRAVAEAPHMREPYVEFAQAAAARHDWPLVLHLTQAALSIHKKSSTYVNMGYAWDDTPHRLLAEACKALGIDGASLSPH